MAIEDVENGETGLSARTKINNNFHQLEGQLNNLFKTVGLGGDYATITEAKSAGDKLLFMISDITDSPVIDVKMQIITNGFLITGNATINQDETSINDLKVSGLIDINGIDVNLINPQSNTFTIDALAIGANIINPRTVSAIVDSSGNANIINPR